MKATKSQLFLLHLEDPTPITVGQMRAKWISKFGDPKEKDFLYPALADLIKFEVFDEFDIEFSGAWDLATADHEEHGEIDFDELSNFWNLSELVGLSTGAIHFAFENIDMLRHDAKIHGFDVALRSLDALELLKSKSEQVAVPASDRIVSLSDNAGVSRALEDVENAIEAVRQSNNLDQEQKSVIQSSLELGTNLLKQPLAYVGAAVSLLLMPLYNAYSSALEEAAKPKVEAAIQAVKAVFGIS